MVWYYLTAFCDSFGHCPLVAFDKKTKDLGQNSKKHTGIGGIQEIVLGGKGLWLSSMYECEILLWFVNL